MRRFVLRNPMWLPVLCVVLCSVAGSVGAMIALGLVLSMSRDWMFGRALVIAIVVPTLVSLPISLIIIRLMHEVEDARAVAQRMAWKDELTGLLNRRRFTEIVHCELICTEHTGQPLVIAVVDLDDFKLINDRHGHAAGDAVLCAVAGVIQAAVRATDLSARWGGEEFCIALPGANVEQALIVAQHVRVAISELRVVTDAGELVTCTASIGIARRENTDQSLDALLNRADRAMYGAKQSGKNCVMLANLA